MNIWAPSKCKLCNKASTVIELKSNEGCAGHVCLDTKACIGRIAKNWLPKNP
jgi:hypothetical protein